MTSPTLFHGPLNRQRPDWKYYPPAHSRRWLWPWHRLVTIFDHEKAAARGYEPIDFNPNPVVPNNPNERGRFSATLTSKFASKYFAEVRIGQDERISIWETLLFEDVVEDPDGKLIVPRVVIRPYSYLYVRPRLWLQLVNLRSQSDATRFHADARALQGENFRITREWARYIRDRIRKLDGLAYLSHRYNSSVGAGHAIVLFENLPHSNKANVAVKKRSIRQSGPIIRMTSDRGELITIRALRPLNFTFK